MWEYYVEIPMNERLHRNRGKITKTMCRRYRRRDYWLARGAHPVVPSFVILVKTWTPRKTPATLTERSGTKNSFQTAEPSRLPKKETALQYDRFLSHPEEQRQPALPSRTLFSRILLLLL